MKMSVRVFTVYPTVPAVGVFVFGVVNAIAGGLLVPAVSTDGACPSAKRQLFCAPAFAGITSLTLPPTDTRPAVVNDTVATDSKPGVSVAVANVAVASAPAAIWSVARLVSPSMSLSWLSCVLPATLLAATMEDGVRTFVIVNTCAVAWAMGFVATVNVSTRVAYVFTVAAGEFVPGVLKATAGRLLPALLATPAASVGSHVDVGSASAGNVSTTLPPTAT